MIKKGGNGLMKVSCIIPAYNEEERIGNVLKVIEKVQFVSEIIVIDDCSKDNTSKVAKKFGKVILIKHKKNQGKTSSVVEAVKIVKNDFIMMIDADLIGLNLKNINDLALPVLLNQADVSISLRGNSLRIYKMLGIDFVSGERVFHKRLFKNINEFRKLPGFGLESFLNMRMIKNKLRIKIVKWGNVSHARKHEKVGYFKGHYEDIKMFFQIVSVLGLRGIFYQINNLRKLRVN